MVTWLQKYSKIIVFFILAWMMIVSLAVSNQESTTMDEQAHIPAGYTYVKYQDMRLNPEHPPLLKDLAGIPLLFLDVKFPLDDPAWQTGINSQWSLGNKFINETPENNADLITFWSRYPIILVALLLGYFIYRWTRELAGAAAGLFALTLYAFDPNILGHSHYVTTDIGIAAGVFISFYYFIKFLKNPSRKNTLLAGIFLAVAQLVKFSAVLLFPYYLLIIIIYSLFKKKPDFIEKKVWIYKLAKFWNYLWKYAVIVGVCFIIIWIVYLFNTWRMPAEKVQAITNDVFHGQDFTFNDLKEKVFHSCGDNCKKISKNDISQKIVMETSKISFLKGLSEYFLGVFMVFQRVSGGNTYYFLGEVNNQANPWYFPAVFAFKETLIFLFLIMFSLAYVPIKIVHAVKNQAGKIWRKFWLAFKNFFQTKLVHYSTLGFIAIYAYLSITGNLNIGFRHLFPILPFAYMLVAKNVFDFYHSIHREKARYVAKYLIILIGVMIVLEPIIYFPSYLSYFNQIMGGPKNGYKYVTDSNYDWGQDLKRLHNWVNNYNACYNSLKCDSTQQSCHKNTRICNNIFLEIINNKGGNYIDKIRIDYFGGSNPKYYFKEKFISWHGDLDPEPGWYAISATFLQESIHKKKQPGEKSYLWLTRYKPVARAGDSIFIYYIPELEAQTKTQGAL